MKIATFAYNHGPFTSEEISWPDLKARLAEDHPVPLCPIEEVDKGKQYEACKRFKNTLPGWAPVETDGLGRSDPNVLAMTALVYDFDGVTVAELEAVINAVKGYECLIHSTHAHREAEGEDGQLRLRLVMPFETPYGRAGRATSGFKTRWEEIWQAGRTRFAPNTDRACKNLSRLYYYPSRHDDVPKFFMAFEGRFLDWNELKSGSAMPDNVVPIRRAEVSKALPAGQSLLDRARAALAKHGPAIEGQNGDAHTFQAGAILFRELGLSEADGMPIAREWNATCQPPWSDEELQLKLANGYRYGTAEEVRDIHELVDELLPKPAEGAEVVAGTLRPDGSVRYPNTDTGNAMRLFQKYGKEIRYLPKVNEWVAWSGKHWQRSAAYLVRAMAIELGLTLQIEATEEYDTDTAKRLAAHASRSQSAYGVDSCVKQATGLSQFWTDAKDFDTNLFLFNAANGTVDLKTGQLKPHTQTDLITRLGPTKFNPDAKCPTFMAFLEQMLPDAELREFLKRALGYGLTGSIEEQVLFFLHGEGSNGKSTLFSAIRAAIGSDYMYNAPPSMLAESKNERHPTEQAGLEGCRLALIAEVNKDQVFNEEIVKRLTDEIVTARKMQKDFSEFKATHKVFLTGNSFPKIRGTEDAIWRRLLLIPFGIQIAEVDKDTTLVNKLAAEAEGILAWCVEGCLAWQRGGLNRPAIVTKASQAYRDGENIVKRFVDDTYEPAPEHFLSYALIYQNYTAWCLGEGEKSIMTKHALSAELKRFGCITARTMSARGVFGLKPRGSGPSLTAANLVN